MRRIAHISDLHFGAEDPEVASGLLEELAARPLDLLAVSGDLTQRARTVEFVAARAFLSQAAYPIIVVPGNHDIPLYNAMARWLTPLNRYRKYIANELDPVFEDAEMIVVGANTARSNTWKSGRISLRQIERIRHFFTNANVPLRVLVAHHPFLAVQGTRTTLVGRHPLALQMLDECGCDLILAGHLHRTDTGSHAEYHIERTRSILIAQAGTAISRRRREEPNTYNYIQYQSNQLQLEVRAWQRSRFDTIAVKTYHRTPDGWSKPLD